jgi:heterodisulfide reductase subunit C
MPAVDAKELTKKFLDEILAIPKGEKINGCIQCGTCSASCPTGYAMEYAPRQIISALRADRIHEVLKSNTVWLCASCYSCAVRCPAGIPFTDVMYHLKRMGEEAGIIPRNSTGPALARIFDDIIMKYGRDAEFQLMRRFYFKTGVFKALGQLGFARRMSAKGRLDTKAHRIKGIDGLRKMMAALKERG